MLFEGKKALVTGSRRGIGRAIAVRLASEGADVGINDIEPDQAAEDTLAMIGDLGRTPSWHRADAGKSGDISRMFDEFLEQHGRIDILVNNAVSSRKRSFLEITEEDWDYEVGNALKGYFLCGQRAAREMVGQGSGGHIVSISSVHAFRSWPNNLVYAICKSGLIRMTAGMAVELAGHDINVNCVAPGFIDSRLLPPEQEHLRAGPGYADEQKKLIPSRRGGVPNDIAGVVAFLCSPAAGYVNGQCITVDGGVLQAGIIQA